MPTVSQMPTQVWIVDDDESIRWVLQKTLDAENISNRQFDNGQTALDALFAGEAMPQVIMSDIRMPQLNGMRFLATLTEAYPQIPVIMMTAHSDLSAAVDSYQTGAYDYVAKPFDIDHALNIVKRALQKSTVQMSSPTKNQAVESTAYSIIGESPAMQEVFRMIGRLSHTDVSVLVNGESGTGKELIANALHVHSPRKNQPFIALNMAAIPKDLIESELFGYEKGAFTGATTQREGRFEQANGGTLFLDEIGDMPLETQTRLLRVLADGNFYRVGGRASIAVNVRIIAATHQDLAKLVADGVFREDLFHRLNVIRLKLPPLRERVGDIPLLCNFFLKNIAVVNKQPEKHYDAATMQVLQSLPWPGNIRQLENICTYCSVMCISDTILPEDLPQDLLAEIAGSATNREGLNSGWVNAANVVVDGTLNGTTLGVTAATAAVDAVANSLIAPSNGHALVDGDWRQQLAQEVSAALSDPTQLAVGDMVIKQVEKLLLETALSHTQGHKQHAAELLGWGRNTITRKLKELGF